MGRGSDDPDAVGGWVQGESGDYRGAYGYGRPAHRTDPFGTYGFEALRPQGREGRARLRRKRATIASVTMRDLRFDSEPDGRQRACVEVEVESLDAGFDFRLDFRLDNQFGTIDDAVTEARDKLIAMFEAAIADLRAGPLRRG